MPGDPPPTLPVSADFLDIVRMSDWGDNHLTFDNPHFVGNFTAAHPHGEWQLVTAGGRLISREAYEVLCTGRAHPDGSFVSGGKTFKLGDDGAFAVLVG